jgi:hypothetical protein
VYGEDYYVLTLMKLIRGMGGSVDVASLSMDGVRLYKHGNFASMKSINDVAKDYDVIILHNVSPRKIIEAKIKYRIKVIMPIYFLWNKTSPLIHNLIGRMGTTMWQFIVDGYVVPSPLIYKGLRFQGIFKKIYIIPPLYKCPYCNFEENIKKRSMLERRLPVYVKVVYIGSLNLKRLPLKEVVEMFIKDRGRTYEIIIYTADNVSEKVYDVKNVRVRIINRILSTEEKCRILQGSHMFIAPRHETTMIPSISVMEAEYHGNIIVRNNANINFLSRQEK